MKMNLNRVLLFASVILAVGLGLKIYWEQYSPAEKWLYLFEEPARRYAVDAMRKAGPPEMPEALAGTTATVHDGYITFSPESDPSLVLAFSLEAPPTDPGNGHSWAQIEGSWYVLNGE